MPNDLLSVNTDDFDAWLRDLSGRGPGDDLSDERLAQLVGVVLREIQPEARARGFVDIANMCYAMADKALGCQTAATKCLEIGVTVNERH